MSKRRTNRVSWAFLFGTLLGLITILVGAAWSLLVSPASVWSESQALEFKAANDALHTARVQRAAGAASNAEAAAAQQRFDRISARLESARSAHDSWGHGISAGGLAVTILCGAGFFMTRTDTDG